ncbi:MAG: GspE/PulE family protein [Patescibacteria group bacterium]|nr:GspE/PulE family protein [Patescibacteria group bacterium]
MNDELPSIEDLLREQEERKAKEADAAPIVPATAIDKPADQEPVVSVAPVAPPAPGPRQPKTKTEEAFTEKMEEIVHKGEETEAQQMATAEGLEYINLHAFAISPDALQLIPEEQAKELKVIAFLFTGPEIRVGAIDPQNQEAKDLIFQLGERHKANAQLYKISQESFDEAFKLYATLPKIRQVVKGVQISQEELDKFQAQMDNFEDIDKVLDKASITDILAIIISAALKLGSSDIHIEAEEKVIAARLRVDGILQDVATIEKNKWKKIISRIKLIAGLKLNITDRPQDGRFTIYQKGKKIDVRTSTLPTSWGESVVMRILNPDAVQLNLEKLGFREAALQKLLPQIEKPHGMIITTGPTGSGKTTTLYAILQRLNKPGVKIITLEDPVEYKIESINQSQIDQTKDYTFAKGLRSILRQDPDIVMVGEIRDLETADTAIQAALTGHLMLSTIHTNDAAGAIPRFVAMGVKPFLLAPAINVIMGQRLARRLCEKCKKPAELEESNKKRVLELLDSIPEASGENKPDTTALTFYSAKGCEACNGTGYSGRVGLYEILIKNEEIEKFILKGEISEYEMREVAQNQGMLIMAQDGLLKALEGLTSVEEVKRVTGL